ncbi:hypothetical protein KR032_006591 [Drosophila birchii]|nr:hypothetical protein KR032_006591 [Drosophila birchii]
MSNLCRSLEEPSPCARSQCGGQMSNIAKIRDSRGFPVMPNPCVSSNNHRGMQIKVCGGPKVNRPDAGRDSFQKYKNQESFDEYTEQESQEYLESGCQKSSRKYWNPCQCRGQSPSLPPPPHKCRGQREPLQKSCGQQTPPPPECYEKPQPPSPPQGCYENQQPPSPPQGCYENQQPPPPSQRYRCKDNSQSPERRENPENPPRPQRCCYEDKPPPPRRCCYEDKPPPPKRCCYEESPSPSRRYCCPDSQPSPQRCCWQDNPPYNCQEKFGNCREKKRRKRCFTRRNCCTYECVVTHEIGIQTDELPPCQPEPEPEPEPPIPDRIEIVDVTTQEREIRHRNGEVEIVVDEIQTITVVPNDGSAPTKRQVLIRTDSSNPNEPQIIETHLNEEIDPDSIEVPDKALRYSQLEPIMTNLADLATTPPSGHASPSEAKDRRVYRTKEQYEQPTEHAGGKQVTKTVVDNTDEILSPKRSPKILSPVMTPKQRKSTNTSSTESKKRVSK